MILIFLSVGIFKKMRHFRDMGVENSKEYNWVMKFIDFYSEDIQFTKPMSAN